VGSRDPILEFTDPPNISRTVGARNFKFGTETDGGMPYNFVPDSFHTRVTAEALRAKIYEKSAISHQLGHFDPKFQVQGVAPTNNICTIS